MNAQEKFETIIHKIEELVSHDNQYPPDEIAQYAAKGNAISLRDLAAVFNFLSGKSLISYIKERRLMAAYHEIINQDKFDVQKAVSVSGYDNQSSFTKAFTHCFGISPKEAHKKSDPQKYKPPLSWDVLGSNTEGDSEKIQNNLHTTDEGSVMNRIFEKAVSAFTANFMETYKEIEELTALYGFSEEQALAAYEVTKYQDVEIQNISITEAFKYVDEYCEIYNRTRKITKKHRKNLYKLLRDELLNPELLYCHFRLNLSVDESCAVESKLFDSYNRNTGERYTVYDFNHESAMLYAYAEGMTTEAVLYFYRYFEEKYDHSYSVNDDDVIQHYAAQLSEGLYKEYALEAAIDEACLDADFDTTDWSIYSDEDPIEDFDPEDLPHSLSSWDGY